MLSDTFLPYNELDPNKKTYEWCNRVVSLYRMYWRKLVSEERAIKNRQLLYAQNSIRHIEESFQDEDFKKATTFKPLGILEGIMNTIVEEITKLPPTVTVKAEDPLSISKKESDVRLLKNRHILENDLSRPRQGIGLGPWKMPYDEFNGNAKQFDDLNLDDRDPEDMEIYQTHFQKLWYEIGAAGALSVILKNNKFDDETLRNLVKDILAYKTIATQTYVDQVTGEIKYKYIDPTYMWGVWGESNSGKDDLCRGWDRMVTVPEWLSMIGDEFDFERDWKDLLWGINFSSRRAYTGFKRGGISYSCFTDTQFLGDMGIKPEMDDLIMWENAYQFKVGVGYIEFKTNEATSTFIKNDNDCKCVDLNYELNKEENTKGYQKTTKYQEQWYRAYFLSTSTITQRIYAYQKIYFQHLEGVNDEYSNGTISYYQEQGQSVVELSESFLNIANFSFYRFLWILFHTKPMKEEYVLDELVTLAKALRKETHQNNALSGAALSADNLLENIIKKMKQGHYNLRVFPKVDGKTLPTLPPEGRKNGDGGLDPTAIVMQNIIEWAEGKIRGIIGYNAMRGGANPPGRESLKTEQNIVASSMNATGYVYRMIQYVKQHNAITTLNYISDIIQYPDSIPYKWLNKILGEEMFGYLLTLEKEIAHRIGIFVHDLNVGIMMQKIMEAANIALSKNEITLEQWLFLVNSQEPHTTSARLALMRRQNEKRLRREAIELENVKAQNALMLEQQKQKTASIPANATVQASINSAQATVLAAEIQAKSREAVKDKQVESELPKQEAKAQGQKDILREKQNLEEQQPLNVSEG